MTQSARTIFVTQLSRAAARQANKFLRARGLQRADRDDVIAAALLWCWENRDNYSLTTTVETWFMNAIRDAYKELQRGALPASDESLENIGDGDETLRTVAAESAAQALVGALTPEHRAAAILTMQGYTRNEIVAKGLTKRIVDESHQRIRQLRRLLPDTNVERFISRTVPPVSSDDADDRLSGIDMELQQLDAPPPYGKECPPCIHCNWWEFSYRHAEVPQVPVTADAEVLAAQRAILQRKIEISSNVERSST